MFCSVELDAESQQALGVECECFCSCVCSCYVNCIEKHAHVLFRGFKNWCVRRTCGGTPLKATDLFYKTTNRYISSVYFQNVYACSIIIYIYIFLCKNKTNLSTKIETRVYMCLCVCVLCVYILQQKCRRTMRMRFLRTVFLYKLLCIIYI